MIFFALLGAITLVAAVAARLGVSGLGDWTARMRLGMVVALMFVGIDHLLTPDRYLPMMPSLVPWPYEVVLFTGLCEIAGAVGLLVPRLRRIAGTALAVYFVCVFPANIKNALDGLSVEGLPTAAWYYWVRLPFQPIAIVWALWCAGIFAPQAHSASQVQQGGQAQ